LNAGMYDSFQIGPGLLRRRIGTEHTLTDFAAIDVAVGSERVRSKPGAKLRFDRLLIQHRMAGGVAVHDLQIVFFLEGVGQKTLPGPNASDQTDDRR